MPIFKSPTSDALNIRGIPYADRAFWGEWCKKHHISQAEALARFCHLLRQGHKVGDELLRLPPRPREFQTKE